jgi:hypothetical protein
MFVMVVMLLLSGCGPALWSVQPLATAETAVFDAGLTGEWLCADKGCSDVALIIRAASAQKKDYDVLRIPGVTGEDLLHLKGQLVKVGDRLVFDLIAVKQTYLAVVPVHFFMLVEKTADGVKFHFLDSEWLRSQVISQNGLAHTTVDDMLVITAGSAEISAFLAKFGLDAQAVSGSRSFKPVKGQ